MGLAAIAIGWKAVGGLRNFRLSLDDWRLTVPLYLGRFKYSADALKAMVENPQDRGAAAEQAAESLGCKLQGIWWTLGDRDGAFILEAPDSVTVVALSMAIGATGEISSEATELFDMNDAQEAMRKAAAVSFRPPG